MNPLNFFKDWRVANRKQDEAYYAQALREFNSKGARTGLMAKAISQCNGDEAKANAYYLSLLARALKDDDYITNRTEEKRQMNAIQNQKPDHDEPIYKPLYVPGEKVQKKNNFSDLAGIILFLGIIAYGAYIIFDPDYSPKNPELKKFHGMLHDTLEKYVLPEKPVGETSALQSKTSPQNVVIRYSTPSQTVTPQKSDMTRPQSSIPNAEITKPQTSNLPKTINKISSQTSINSANCSRIYWATVNAARNKPIAEYLNIEKEAAARQSSCRLGQ